MAEKKTAAKKTAGSGDDNVTSLADAAKGALGNDGTAEQDKLEGTDYARVSFNGMGWDTVQVPDLKEKVEFVIVGTVMFHGEKVYKDGEVRPVATVEVEGVRRVSKGTYDRQRDADAEAERERAKEAKK